jgi:triosephosphate isomerase (TIM)
MRKKLLAGNWKMHKLRGETKSFFDALVESSQFQKINSSNLEIAFGVPATSFETALLATQNKVVKILAQNCHWESQGAFTGELSTAMLQDAGLAGSIIGHSERRQYFAESSIQVGKKWNALANLGLLPVVCVGETKSEREQNQTINIVRQQIDDALSQVTEEARKFDFVIAYEPVWAIGTGLTATPQMAQEVHAFIRSELTKYFGKDRSDKIKILYGGSLIPANAKELLSQPDIDGGLIGGASLKTEDFTKLIEIASGI